MIIHNITVWSILSHVSQLPSTGTYMRGFVERNGWPVQVSPDSKLLHTDQLSRICFTLTPTTGRYPWDPIVFLDFPLFTLVQRSTTPTGIYRVDGCTSPCYDVYLECSAFPFRLDDTGDLRVSFESKWSAACFSPPLTRDQASQFCAKLNLPSNNAKLLPGSPGNTTSSWLISDTCVSKTSTNCPTIRNLTRNSCTNGSLVALRCDVVDAVPRIVTWGNGGVRGTLEMKLHDKWLPVCSRNFTLNDAAVVCRTKGHPSTDANYMKRRLNTPDFRKERPGYFRCNGSESDLKQCRGLRRNYLACTSDYIIDVSCDEAREGKVRLTGGYDGLSGRLEMYHDNNWGAFCNDSFGQTEINLACSQVTNGTVREGRHISGLNVLPTAVSMVMTGVRCRQGETSLADCQYSQAQQRDCRQSFVYLACNEEPQFKINPVSGLLQVYHDKDWGAICGSSFDNNDARVMCKTKGLPSQATYFVKQKTSADSGRIWLDGLNCGEGVQSVAECTGWHWGEVSSACKSATSVHVFCPKIDKRRATFSLNNLGGEDLGVVSVSYDGNMGGRVCMRRPTQEIAKVACRTLELPSEHAMLLTDSPAGRDMQTTYLNDIECTGDESNLLDCSFVSLKRRLSCERSNILVMSCAAALVAEPDYTLRLHRDAPGGGSYGRLEVLRNGVWGTVCRNGFTNISALVACRQLGLPTSSIKVFETQSFGGNGPMWLVGVRCQGSEAGLQYCPTVADDTRRCYLYSNTVGISCGRAGSSEDRERPRITHLPVGWIVGGCFLGFGVLVVLPIAICCLVGYVQGKRERLSKNPIQPPQRCLGKPLVRVGQEYVVREPGEHFNANPAPDEHAYQNTSFSTPSRYADSQPSRYPDSQPSRYPDSQPSRYPDSQPSRYADSLPSRYPDSQSSPYADSQPSRYPDSQPSRSVDSQQSNRLPPPPSYAEVFSQGNVNPSSEDC